MSWELSALARNQILDFLESDYWPTTNDDVALPRSSFWTSTGDDELSPELRVLGHGAVKFSVRHANFGSCHIKGVTLKQLPI